MDEKEQLRKIQIVTNDILDEVVRVCEENNIIYYLAYGTLLGAVCHKGFIPWDDDIDIWMFRDDYDRFVEIANDCLHDGYFLQNSDTDGCFPVAMSKVRMSGTFSSENSFGNEGNKGIFIDIFPLDKYPNNREKARKIWKKCCRINKLIVVTFLKSSNHRSSIKNLTIKLSQLLLNRKLLINKLFSIIYRYSKINSTKYGLYTDSPFEFFDFSDLGNDTFMLFANKKYRVPNNYEYILEEIYGDYMKLPPADERKHHFKDIDFGDYFENLDYRKKTNARDNDNCS